MNKDELKKRMDEIQEEINNSVGLHHAMLKQIEQHIANHNVLLGRLDEAKFYLAQHEDQDFKESIENHELEPVPVSE